MDEQLKAEVMEVLKARRDAGVLESEADFLCGVMAAYLAMNPESKDNGAWAPTEWIFTLMRGDSPLDNYLKEEE